jgi:mannose-1-phosphate guanylyltransferase / phosphomannomutase
MKVVIIAGGKGTRIASVNNEIPKAMIPIAGKPVLEYQIELAKRYGFKDIILIIGFLGNVIEDYFQDGLKWGVSINYYKEEKALGTAGALPYLKELLTEDFFVFYGDTVMDIALDQMLAFHNEKNSDATLFLHPNDHPYDSDLVSKDEYGRITDFFSKPYPEGFVCKNLVNAALYILSPSIIDNIPVNKKSDFGKDIFPTCLEKKINLYGYLSTEYIKDMGTPDRYEKVSGDVISGKVAKSNNRYSKNAVFLDRDGVISRDIDLLNMPSQLELIKGASEAIKLINRSGYLAIIVTNQPVIARNLCSIDELNIIHNLLETLLGKDHAYVDAIYFCPHHPDSGYPEERKEFKINCDCRKPKPGMIIQASHDWNIDLKNSYMIGDRKTDIEAGINAGLKESFLIEQNADYALLNLIKKIFSYDNIENSI